MPAFESVLEPGELDKLVTYINWLRDDNKQAQKYWVESAQVTFPSVVERGDWLYHRAGCAACHGPAGIGGVENQNASGGFVPALNDMAEKMELFEPEDISKVVAVFERGLRLDDAALDDDMVPDFSSVQNQYASYRDFIVTGGKPGKQRGSTQGPAMLMPAWKYRLYADDSPTSPADIDAVIAYLLTLQRFDDDDDEDE
jgi:mono/diheme cytochrome c family protein